jgi:hypothetical protein
VKFILRLERRAAAQVKLLDHPARLIEVLVDDALRATAKFRTDPRHPSPPRCFRHRAYDASVPAPDGPGRLPAFAPGTTGEHFASPGSSPIDRDAGRAGLRGPGTWHVSPWHHPTTFREISQVRASLPRGAGRKKSGNSGTSPIDCQARWSCRFTSPRVGVSCRWGPGQC